MPAIFSEEERRGLRLRMLDIGWELLRILPGSELKRIRDEYLARYYEPGQEEKQKGSEPA